MISWNQLPDSITTFRVLTVLIPPSEYWLFCLLLGPPGFNCWFSFAPVFSGVVRHPGDLWVSVATRCFCRVLIFFHHSIYLWFICFPWWSIDELENIHADWTTVCFEPWQKPRARLGSRKTGLSPPSILILTVPRRYFCCGSLLLLVLAVRFILWFTYYVSDIF